ncbi:MAG: hypothetical protein WC760_08365 [Bacteroidia bacterium]
MHSLLATAQQENNQYSNRISFGLGGEDGFLGIDYSGDIYKSRVFLGIGTGLGTGLTGYLRFEPFNWYGLTPFISPAVSHTFGGTLILSPGTSVFSISTGLNYLPKLKWKSIPTLGLGITYYSILTNTSGGDLNGFGPLIKIGYAFSKKIN